MKMMKSWHARKQLKFCWVFQRIIDAIRYKINKKLHKNNSNGKDNKKKWRWWSFDMQEDNGEEKKNEDNEIPMCKINKKWSLICSTCYPIP